MTSIEFEKVTEKFVMFQDIPIGSIYDHGGDGDLFVKIEASKSIMLTPPNSVHCDREVFETPGDESVICYKVKSEKEVDNSLASLVLVAVLEEVEQAREKHPGWPTNPFHALAIIGEEVGELNQAVLEFTYSATASKKKVYEEAVQCMAMCFEFLLHIGCYEFQCSGQTQHLPLPKSKNNL
jgi:hypothetical protein